MGKGKLKKTLGSSKGKRALAIGGAVAGAIGLGAVAKKVLGGRKGGIAGKRRKKKSAVWYAKETLRLKLKRKYEKERMRI